MSLNKSTVRAIAFLARLDLSEEAIEPLIEELSAILQWTEKLQSVDTTNVEPMPCINFVQSYWREDAINDGGYAETVLTNAPESAKGFFLVPKVVN